MAESYAVGTAPPIALYHEDEGSSMSTADPQIIDSRWGPQLAAMSIAEKEALLNLLLVDLAQLPEKVQPEEWPHRLLQERKQAVEDGRVQLKDWEMAKQDILNRVARK